MPTHVSLAKAGKVRQQTLEIEGRTIKSKIPKSRSRRNYEKRIILEKNPGQDWKQRRR